jgi:hypothetical protein
MRVSRLGYAGAAMESREGPRSCAVPEAARLADREPDAPETTGFALVALGCAD